MITVTVTGITLHIITGVVCFMIGAALTAYILIGHVGFVLRDDVPEDRP